MSALSLMHIAAATFAVLLGIAIFVLRKGDARHRVLGWTYLALMLVGLIAIIAAGRAAPRPFHGYALIIALGMLAAVLASRLRARIRGWRAWHAALMSFSMLGAAVAVGGVLGGLVLGVGSGPGYFLMFNGVILLVTGLGLSLILRHPAIWGRTANATHQAIRIRFGAGVGAISGLLILTQWLLFH